MKKGWQTKTIGEVCDLATGGTPSRAKPEYFGGDIKWLVSGDINQGEIFDCEGRITEAGKKNSNAKLLPINSVMIALNGQGKTRGTVALLRTHATCNQSMVCISPKPSSGLLPEFLYANLHGRYEEIRRMTSDDDKDRRGLNMGLVRSIKIPIAPLAEQQRIVGLLDEAFEDLATAKANAEKNLQNARALFESHLHSVFTQRGPGWLDTALGDVCGFVRGPFGGSLKKSIFVADGYAVYEQQHAIYNQFDDVRYFIDEAKFKEMKRFELLPADLIMSCSGTMGRVAIVPKEIKRGIINQALLKLTPSSKILNTFLKSWMESEAFQDALKEYSGGAAIQNVASVKILKEIKVALPSMSDQNRIVEELDDLRGETQRLARLYERKLAALAALKKSLLHQAFSGGL